jgi:polysaccharide biosynthesis protein PelD
MKQTGQGDVRLIKRIAKKIPWRLLGLRTTAVLETVAFLITITAVNYLFADGARFIDFSPHPYWIIILLITLQYGTNEALMSTALSTVFLLFWNLPEQQMDQSTFDYVFTITSRPLMWMMASVVLGELRVRHIQQNDKLQMELNAVLNREHSITRAYEQLREVKESLETRIAGHLQSSVSSYKSLKSIEGLNPVQILMGVGDMVGNVLNPEQYSVYGYGPNGFEVISSEGWDESDSYSRRLSQESPLYQELVNHHRVICVINRLDAEILGAEGILAGPLVDPQDGKIFGMLKIETFDFIDLTVVNVETFKALCEWAGSAYAQARQFQETLLDGMHNLETGILSNRFEKIQRTQLENLKKELDVDSTAIKIKLTNVGQLTGAERVSTAIDLLKLLKSVLPSYALICEGRRPNVEFVIWLPGAGSEVAESISQNIDDNLHSSDNPSFQRLEVELSLAAAEGASS